MTNNPNELRDQTDARFLTHMVMTGETTIHQQNQLVAQNQPELVS
jgi:hypothetical protein